MSSVLAVAALIILLALALLSFKRQRETAASEKQRALVRSHEGDAQHERSTSRRAEVRLAGPPASASDAELPSTRPANHD
jgi:type II secretory pathway pseudopilin PulG